MADYIFGITGPTGAGKSTVSDMFRKRGIYVADADEASRRVTEKGSQCLDEIRNAFGGGILNECGALDREKLGTIVFGDRKKLEILTRITHKYIKEYIADEIDRSGAAIAAIDGAVIIGSPVYDMCRCMVVVTADKDIRLKRIMRRDGIDGGAAVNRINSQPEDCEYIKYADYVIENNGSKIQGEQIEHICNQIKSEAKNKSKTTPL